MYKIIAVKALKNYQLEICFEDGARGIVNLVSLVGKGIFSSWKDYKEFKKVYIDETSHTVAWPNGIDLAPEALYEEVCNQKKAA